MSASDLVGLSPEDGLSFPIKQQQTLAGIESIDEQQCQDVPTEAGTIAEAGPEATPTPADDLHSPSQPKLVPIIADQSAVPDDVVKHEQEHLVPSAAPSNPTALPIESQSATGSNPNPSTSDDDLNVCSSSEPNVRSKGFSSSSSTKRPPPPPSLDVNPAAPAAIGPMPSPLRSAHSDVSLSSAPTVLSSSTPTSPSSTSTSSISKSNIHSSVAAAAAAASSSAAVAIAAAAAVNAHKRTGSFPPRASSLAVQLTSHSTMSASKSNSKCTPDYLHHTKRRFYNSCHVCKCGAVPTVEHVRCRCCGVMYCSRPRCLKRLNTDWHHFISSLAASIKCPHCMEGATCPNSNCRAKKHRGGESRKYSIATPASEVDIAMRTITTNVLSTTVRTTPMIPNTPVNTFQSQRAQLRSQIPPQPQPQFKAKSLLSTTTSATATAAAPSTATTAAASASTSASGSGVPSTGAALPLPPPNPYTDSTLSFAAGVHSATMVPFGKSTAAMPETTAEPIPMPVPMPIQMMQMQMQMPMSMPMPVPMPIQMQMQMPYPHPSASPSTYAPSMGMLPYPPPHPNMTAFPIPTAATSAAIAAAFSIPNWSVAQVTEFVEQQLNMKTCAVLLHAKQIDGSSFVSLSINDLLEAGIHATGDQMTLMHVIQTIRNQWESAQQRDRRQNAITAAAATGSENDSGSGKHAAAHGAPAAAAVTFPTTSTIPRPMSMPIPMPVSAPVPIPPPGYYSAMPSVPAPVPIPAPGGYWGPSFVPGVPYPMDPSISSPSTSNPSWMPVPMQMSMPMPMSTVPYPTPPYTTVPYTSFHPPASTGPVVGPSAGSGPGPVSVSVPSDGSGVSVGLSQAFPSNHSNFTMPSYRYPPSMPIPMPMSVSIPAPFPPMLPAFVNDASAASRSHPPTPIR